MRQDGVFVFAACELLELLRFELLRCDIDESHGKEKGGEGFVEKEAKC